MHVRRSTSCSPGLDLPQNVGRHYVTGFSSVELGKKKPSCTQTVCNFVLVAFLSDRLRHETRSATGEHIDYCIDRVWEIMGDMVRDYGC